MREQTLLSEFSRLPQESQALLLEMEEGLLSPEGTYAPPPPKEAGREDLNADAVGRSLRTWTIKLARRRWPNNPHTNTHRMIAVIFDDAFTEQERDVIIAGFKRWLEITVVAFENNSGFHDISGYNHKLPDDVVHPGTGSPFPEGWTDQLKMYMFMATMSNKPEPESPTRLPRHRPIYVHH